MPEVVKSNTQLKLACTSTKRSTKSSELATTNAELITESSEPSSESSELLTESSKLSLESSEPLTTSRKPSTAYPILKLNYLFEITTAIVNYNAVLFFTTQKLNIFEGWKPQEKQMPLT